MADIILPDGSVGRQIDNFPDYAVCRNGDVWSRRRYGNWRRLKPAVDQDRLSVVLHCGNGPQPKSVHTLVLETFVGPKPDGMEACHFPDPSPANNNVENLQWGTKKTNQGHRIIHGTTIRGTKHPLAKLNDEKVLEIRRRVAAGETKLSMAVKFGVDPVLIGSIIKRTAWPHVP